jgi:hypothetical protein
LYYEIQSLNDYGSESLEALAQASSGLRSAVISQDFAAFEALIAPRPRSLRGSPLGDGAACVNRATRDPYAGSAEDLRERLVA